jgi:hypothetical protein
VFRPPVVVLKGEGRHWYCWSVCPGFTAGGGWLWIFNLGSWGLPILEPFQLAGPKWDGVGIRAAANVE